MAYAVHTGSLSVTTAHAPDVTTSSTGEFVVAWHEEHFPLTKTVIQTIQ